MGRSVQRSVIDQAIGVIIGLQRCDPEAAFDVPRAVSPNRNIPLGDVAADALARTIDPAGRHRPPRQVGDRLHQFLDRGRRHHPRHHPRHLRVGRGPRLVRRTVAGCVVTGRGNLSITWRG
ncbi:MAG TPA: ANTAR domain-containing protein [Nakamurella sp.]|nr:ANTAR domain-containing protein [Nakamurella sp.]